MKLGHVTIQTRDLEKSIGFYEEACGLVVRSRMGDAIAFMGDEASPTAVELIAAEDGRCFRGSGISLGFEVDDVEVEWELKSEKGYKPGAIHRPNPQVAFFFIKDPDGVPVQFIQYLCEGEQDV